jgi:hypothetical protein
VRNKVDFAIFFFSTIHRQVLACCLGAVVYRTITYTEAVGGIKIKFASGNAM